MTDDLPHLADALSSQWGIRVDAAAAARIATAVRRLLERALPAIDAVVTDPDGFGSCGVDDEHSPEARQ